MVRAKELAYARLAKVKTSAAVAVSGMPSQENCAENVQENARPAKAEAQSEPRLVRRKGHQGM